MCTHQDTHVGNCFFKHLITLTIHWNPTPELARRVHGLLWLREQRFPGVEIGVQIRDRKTTATHLTTWHTHWGLALSQSTRSGSDSLCAGKFPGEVNPWWDGKPGEGENSDVLSWGQGLESRSGRALVTCNTAALTRRDRSEDGVLETYGAADEGQPCFQGPLPQMGPCSPEIGSWAKLKFLPWSLCASHLNCHIASVDTTLIQHVILGVGRRQRGPSWMTEDAVGRGASKESFWSWDLGLLA